MYAPKEWEPGTFSLRNGKLTISKLNGMGARDISVKKWEINYFKIKFLPFIMNFR